MLDLLVVVVVFALPVFKNLRTYVRRRNLSGVKSEVPLGRCFSINDYVNIISLYPFLFRVRTTRNPKKSTYVFVI